MRGVNSPRAPAACGRIWQILAEVGSTVADSCSIVAESGACAHPVWRDRKRGAGREGNHQWHESHEYRKRKAADETVLSPAGFDLIRGIREIRGSRTLYQVAKFGDRWRTGGRAWAQFGRFVGPFWGYEALFSPRISTFLNVRTRRFASPEVCQSGEARLGQTGMSVPPCRSTAWKGRPTWRRRARGWVGCLRW